MEGCTPAKARQAALRLLSRRDHSEQELRRKLADKGCENGLISRLLDEFRELGYTGDDAYAERQVRSLACDKLYGNRRVEHYLTGRGLTREQIRQAIAAVRAEFSETRALEMLIRKKVPGPSFVNDDRGKRRLVQSLMGRGFSPGIIFETLERILEEQKA